MLSVRHKTGLRASLQVLGVLAFSGYFCWNVFWLSKGQVPPSIWLSITGLPCPSTGVFRSLKAAFAGNYLDFILYNPFTIPFLGLTIFSFYSIIRSWKAKQELLLPSYLGYLWLITIVAAWLSKFIIGRQYW